MDSGQVLNQPVLVSACTVVVITRRNSTVVNSGKVLPQRNLKRIVLECFCNISPQLLL